MSVEQLVAERFNLVDLEDRVDELTSMVVGNRVPNGAQIEVVRVATNGFNQMESIAEFFGIEDAISEDTDEHWLIGEVLDVLNREVGYRYGITLEFDYATRTGDFSLVFYT